MPLAILFFPCHPRPHEQRQSCRSPVLRAPSVRIGPPESPCTKAQVERAVEELTRWEKREAKNPVYELKPAVRRACIQLLGSAPDHPLGDFIRHSPPDIMGEENAKRWQEQYRKRKEKEAEEAKAEEQPQE
jgi:hypothetical protein